MIRNIVAPVQAWMLSQGKCVGCGTPLVKGNVKKFKVKDKIVTCKCGRIFVFETQKKRYRRALLKEI